MECREKARDRQKERERDRKGTQIVANFESKLGALVVDISSTAAPIRLPLLADVSIFRFHRPETFCDFLFREGGLPIVHDTVKDCLDACGKRLGLFSMAL